MGVNRSVTPDIPSENSVAPSTLLHSKALKRSLFCAFLHATKGDQCRRSMLVSKKRENGRHMSVFEIRGFALWKNNNNLFFSVHEVVSMGKATKTAKDKSKSNVAPMKNRKAPAAKGVPSKAAQKAKESRKKIGEAPDEGTLDTDADSDELRIEDVEDFGGDADDLALVKVCNYTRIPYRSLAPQVSPASVLLGVFGRELSSCVSFSRGPPAEAQTKLNLHP